MGTDIHVVCEDSYDSATDWTPSYEIDFHVMRNYPLFARLANLRNNFGETYITEPRGFPVDVHPKTRQLLTGLHDVSWVTLAEARSVRGVSDNWDHLVEYLATQYYSYTVRFVIGFDN